jgi:hypothetical protein
MSCSATAISLAIVTASFGTCAGFLLAGLFALGQDPEPKIAPAPDDNAEASLVLPSEPPHLSADPPGPNELRH